jgi:hypothetical protein
VHKFPEWPPGARTVNSKVIYEWAQSYRYFVSLVSFAAVILYMLFSECLLLFISLSTQSGNFWIHPRMY